MRGTIHAAMLAALVLGAGPAAGPAAAQNRGDPWSATPVVRATDGEGVYREVCQACHMPRGEGARGAADYPALADNPRLEAAGYPVTLVLHGQRAMPGFAPMLTDAQVAEVVTYIRTHFGNDFAEPVAASEVEAMR